jgi:signal peptidase II
MARNADNAPYSRLLGPVVILAIVVAVDQATKIWAVAALDPRTPVKIIGSLVQFTLVYNEGGAMGTSFGSSTYYLISSLLILGFVLYYMVANRHLGRVTYPLALIAGGAIGNIIDRIRLGQVIDFLDIDILDVSLWGFNLQRWWTFNVADAAITLSIIYLIISLFLHRRDTDEALPEVADEAPPGEGGRTESI